MVAAFSNQSQAAGLADLKFGRAQIADSQWNVQACTQTATCQIYSKNPGTVYKIPWTSGQLSWVTGDYVAFVTTGNATNPFNAIQYYIRVRDQIKNIWYMMIMNHIQSNHKN